MGIRRKKFMTHVRSLAVVAALEQIVTDRNILHYRLSTNMKQSIFM